MKRIYIVLIIIFCVFPVHSVIGAEVLETREEIFHDANKAYSEGFYVKAEEGYRKLFVLGLDSAEIHNNLGEALYRQGKKGEAIFQFMLAERLKPRNADIKYNLDYARDRITDKLSMPHVNIMMRPFAYINGHLSLKEGWILFVIFSSLFWVGLAVRFFVRKDWLKWMVLAFGVLFALQSAVLVKKEFLTHPFGVITAEEANIYSGPGEDNVLLFKLHEGSNFDVMPRKENEWLQIRLKDGKKGWIQSAEVIFVNSSPSF